MKFCQFLSNFRYSSCAANVHRKLVWLYFDPQLLPSNMGNPFSLRCVYSINLGKFLNLSLWLKQILKWQFCFELPIRDNYLFLASLLQIHWNAKVVAPYGFQNLIWFQSGKKIDSFLCLSRDCVSVGAVGEIAPTVSEKSIAFATIVPKKCSIFEN